MKKVFYWSPHLSNVATIKNVINSAKSVKKFSKKDINVSIIDAIGEWDEYFQDLDLCKVNQIKLSKLNLKKYLPISGFLKSRIFYLIIFLSNFFPLNGLLKKEKPDYLIIHLISVLPLALLLFIKTETKFILRISGLPRLNFLRKFFWKLISNKIYLVTCPSHQTKIDLIENKIFKKEKVEVLFDPIIEVKIMNEKVKIYDKITKNLENDIFFLNIGRLTKQKNQKILISAFSKIVPTNKNLKLIIAGEGEKKKELENQIISLGLEKNQLVIFNLNQEKKGIIYYFLNVNL